MEKLAVRTSVAEEQVACRDCAAFISGDLQDLAE